MLRKYEVMYILRHDSPADATQAAIDKIRNTIIGQGGTILLHESWGKKKLAYEIKKSSKGIYQLTTFAAAPEAIREMERIMRIQPEVLRWLTVQLSDVVEDLNKEIEHYSQITPKNEPLHAEEDTSESAERAARRSRDEEGDRPKALAIAEEDDEADDVDDADEDVVETESEAGPEE